MKDHQLPMKPQKEHWSHKIKRENAQLTLENLDLKKEVSSLKRRLTEKMDKSVEKRDDEKDSNPDDPEDGNPSDSDDYIPKFITVFVRIFVPDDMKQTLRVRVFDNDQTFKDFKFQIEGMTNISAFKMRFRKTQSIASEEYADDDMLMDYINVNPLRLPTTIFVEVFNLDFDEERKEMNIVEQFGGQSKGFMLKIHPNMSFSDLEFLLQGKYGISTTDLKLRPKSEPLTHDEAERLMKQCANLEVSLGGFGGGPKRRRASIADMKAKPNDIPLVQSCFSITEFKEKPWLESLTMAQRKTYLKDLKANRTFNAHVALTTERIREYVALKDFLHFPGFVFNHNVFA